MISANNNLNSYIYNSKKHKPSFKAVSYDTIGALKTEVTGQKTSRSYYYGIEIEQLSDLKYRLFSDFEKEVVAKINEKARANTTFDVHIIREDSDERNYINKHGDTLVIIDRKSNRAVRKIPKAIGNNLNPVQQINNLKFAVDTAEKFAKQRSSGIKGLFGKIHSSAKILQFNDTYGSKLFKNTALINNTPIIDSSSAQMEFPLSDILDIEGLELEKPNPPQYAKFDEQNRVNTHHNVIQRSIINIDAFEKLSKFLSDVSPELEEKNEFTLDMYNQLDENQKKQLRDFCSDKLYLEFGENSTSTKINIDYEYVEYFNNIIRKNLDDKYGKNNYVLWGIGSSPACMLSLLAQDIETKNIPFSRQVLNPWNNQVLKDTNKKIDWKKYFESFGITQKNVEKLKEEGKTIIITDYTDTGKTINSLKEIFKKIGISPDDLQFEDLSDICNSSDPEDMEKNRIFFSQFLDGKKLKLYSTCQNAGNKIDFYENTDEYIKGYKWHPLTKLFFFCHYDNLAQKTNSDAQH